MTKNCGALGRLDLRRSGAALALAAVALLAAPAGAVAQSVTLGQPSATSTFGQQIVFTQPYDGPSVGSAWIVLTFPGNAAPSLRPVDEIGPASLTYTLDTSAGDLTPFEPVTAQFEAVLYDGVVQAGPQFSVTYADDRFKWQTVSGPLVRIHWFSGSVAFAKQLLSYGQQGFARAAAFFGIAETKPVDFYVYPSQAAFEAGLNAPQTIGGDTEATYRTCFALVAPTDLAYGSRVVPHELTHMAIADTINYPDHALPTWLDEGLAMYLSEGYSSHSRSLVTQASKNGTLAPLEALTGEFPLDPAHVYFYYAESVSAVAYMVRKYGQADVQKLLRAYAAGASNDEAFGAGLGIDMAAFGRAWLADNGFVAARSPSPQPSPAGPLPSGSATPGVTAAPPSPTPTMTPTPLVSPTRPASSPSGSAGGPGGTAGSPGTAALLLIALVVLVGLAILGAWALRNARSGRSTGS